MSKIRLTNFSIELTVMPGSELSNTIREARYLATILRCPVSFTFNDHELLVTEDSSIDEIYNSYWVIKGNRA